MLLYVFIHKYNLYLTHYAAIVAKKEKLKK